MRENIDLSAWQNRILNNIGLYAFITVLAVAPFLSPSSTVLVRQILPTALFIRYGAFFALAAWLWQSAAKGKLDFKIYLFLAPLLSLGVASTVSSLLSGNWHVAVFGDPKSAMHGVYFWLSLLIMAFLAGNLLTKERLSTLTNALSAVVAFLTLLAVVQYFFSLLPLVSHSVRAFATLINPLELAGFMLLALPLLMLKFLESGLSKREAFFRGFTVISAYLAIYLTGSRAGVLLAVVILALSFYLSGRQAWKKALSMLALSALLFITFIVFLPTTNSDRPAAADVAGSSASSVDSRIATWETAARMIEDKPLIGWGDAQLADHFQGYKDSQFNKRAGQTFSPFDVHNRFLNVTSSGGLLGLFLFLWILLLAAGAIKKALAALPSQEEGYQSEKKGIALGIIVLLTFWLFSPAWQVTELYFWVFLGALFALTAKPRWEIGIKAPQFFTAFFAALTISVLGIGLYFGIKITLAELNATAGLNRALAGDTIQGARLIRKGIQLNPYEPDYYGRLAYAYYISGLNGNSHDFDKSVHWYRKAIAINPRDPFRYDRLAAVYLAMNKKGLLKPGGELKHWVESGMKENPGSENLIKLKQITGTNNQ